MRSMDSYPRAAMDRAMKVQDVMLQAMAKKITWWQAAEILGISDRHMRRWRERYEEVARTGEGGNGASSTYREKNGTTCTTVFQSIGRGTASGIAFSRDERSQTGNGFRNNPVDGGEANNTQYESCVLKGIPFLRR